MNMQLRWHRIFSWARRDGFWWILSIVAIGGIGILVSWLFWGELHCAKDSPSTTVRNLAFVIGGIIAIVLAVWRSRVSECQAATAQGSLLNERYQKGAEMLGSDVLAVRLGGIYALQRLAQERDEYHVPIMRLFCAFVCNPTETKDDKSVATNEEYEHSRPPRPDVVAIMEAIASRKIDRLTLEQEDGFYPDFRYANLIGLNLSRIGNVDLSWSRLTGANLSYIWLPPQTNFSQVREAYGANLSYARLNRVNFKLCNFWGTDLSDSLLIGANLQCADLRKANLANTTLATADLSGATFRDANLSGTQFSLDDHPPARGLTQNQLDDARATADNPPNLNGVLDTHTGKQLVWRGKSLGN